MEPSQRTLPVKQGKNKKNRTNGSIGKAGFQRIIPITGTRSKNCINKAAEMLVKVVSPAQQVVEQAVSETKRQKGSQPKKSTANESRIIVKNVIIGE